MSTNIFLGMPPPKIKEWIIADAERKYQEMLKTPLTFTAEEAGAKLSLVSEGGPDITLETSPTGEEGSWQPYTVGNEIILENIGDKIMFRNSSNEIQAMSVGYGTAKTFKINQKKIAASGNIMFLMDKTGELRSLKNKNQCYYEMFRDCTALTKAPALPATTLADYCYYGMFQGCTSLTKAPELPATTLDSYCYASMFRDCTALTKAPALPATTLASFCYDNMFDGCTSLTKAPKILPATTLSEYCCGYMFRGCTSLTQAPELPAMSLVSGCYSYMFSGCTSLTQAPELPATNIEGYASYDGMFLNCTSIQEPTYIISNLTHDQVFNAIENNCIFGMFYSGDPFEVQCSDKIMIASFDENERTWILTEK